MKAASILIFGLVAFATGCSSEAPTAATSSNASDRGEPPNLTQILSTHEPGVLIGWTYWYCGNTGAMVEAVPAKNSWWWVVEPDNASECQLKQISKERFDELDPRQGNGPNHRPQLTGDARGVDSEVVEEPPTRATGN